jgi:predicted DNA-binding transcriptional regulator AlpA
LSQQRKTKRDGARADPLRHPLDDCSGVVPGTSGDKILAAAPIVAQGARFSEILPRARPAKVLLTADDLADMLGVSRRTVFRLRARGVIPRPLKIGGTLLRWRLNDIVQFLNTSRLA